MTAPTFFIRFIRPEDAFGDNGHKDDHVTITRASADQYKLTFATRFTNSNREEKSVLTLTDREVFRWMRVVLRLLEADGDPYENIQIDQNGMPSILLRVAQKKDGRLLRHIGQHYNLVLDALEFFLDAGRPASSTNGDMDVEEETLPYSEDEDEDEDEDEYADMPALIPPRHMFFDENGNVQRAYY